MTIGNSCYDCSHMDKPKVGPKDFFLWAGAMVALYWSIIAFITLLFEYIDTAFPDPLEYYVDPYSGGIRFAMASLIVLVPVAILLMRFIRNDIARMPMKNELWVRRFAAGYYACVCNRFVFPVVEFENVTAFRAVIDGGGVVIESGHRSCITVPDSF